MKPRTSTRRGIAALALAVSGSACSAGGSVPASGPKVIALEAAPGAVIHQACTPTGSERCFDARDDNCNGIIDEGCGLNTGLVQFVIAWERAGADVDLNVTDPNGELIDVGRAFDSGLVKENDCPGKANACHGQNVENVYLESGDPLRGRYRVAVRLEKLGGENPPIRVTLGARVGPKTYQVEVVLERVEEEQVIVVEL